MSKRFLNSTTFLCVIVSGLALTPPGRAGQVVVLDDKSDFAGFPHTVIDFETCCGGRPIDLRDGDFMELLSTVYAPSGVTISASNLPVFPSPNAFVVNGGPASAFDAAHALVGSPPNFLQAFGSEQWIRFTFSIPVNAAGIGIVDRSDSAGVHLEARDATGHTLGRTLFDQSVADGLILGAEFGTEFDFEYGFLGLWSMEDAIASLTVYEDRSYFDDLYFGFIPEPASGFLASLVLLPMLRRYRRRQRMVVLAAAVMTATVPSWRSLGDVRRTVQGWVIDGPGELCGIAQTGCTQANLDYPAGARIPSRIQTPRESLPVSLRIPADSWPCTPPAARRTMPPD